MNIHEIHGVRILNCPVDGKKLRSDHDAVDLISAAFENRAGLIAVPVERFHPDFFRLKTRLAGEFVEKFVIYRVHLVIVGDISAFVNKSSALRDFVRESNRGENIWFVADLEELAERIECAR